jgi:acyl-coenzyme A thioesterase PaaI-like protein
VNGEKTQMTRDAIQDHYPDDLAVCYGCGRHNPQGLHVRTEWDGREGVFRFTPGPYHTAYPGIVYGGLIASLMDCHCIGTAVAAAYEAEGRMPGTVPAILYVTANLNVSFLSPTPMGCELVLRAKVKEFHERKALIACTLSSGDRTCAKAEVVAVRAKGLRAEKEFL